ncbi:hypothetical protein [Streptomyces sp. BK239]|uniref:hypothetical protein n=1 Tax=Streptomyces sp. BK239 TaxID=2512155 RepID=UPI00102B961B|nr:hypothetical protein [Streptomyces sp. BK239]
MEQRIGSSSQPLEGAGFDPAFIPGLTSPATVEPEDRKPGDAKAARSEAPEAEKADAGKSADETGDESAEEQGAPDGPVFEASDRRARIVADARGVRLRLDEEECEFRWDEIGAVETETPRFGKRYTVTVHTPDRRWYPIEIEATARDRFKEWDDRLDEVLDAYFEDETPAEPAASDDPAEPAEASEPAAADK